MIKNLKYFAIITFVSLLAWYQTLGNWFFKGYEATWLESVTPHTFVNLIRGHAFLYYLDLKLFGWHPWGWYLTSLILHTIASLVLFYLVFLLTKRKILALAASIFFVANTSYNDVLVWGSFNSYYPLLLIFMLLSLVTFHKYKETGKIKFFGFSCIFATLGFFTRETGIVIVPLFTLYDIIFTNGIKNKKTILQVVKRQAPLYILLILFFIVRNWYGGVSGDSVDSLVKMQMKLVKDGLYFQYGTLAVLTAGKLIAPQIAPYPLLNFIRDLINNISHNLTVYAYFYSAIGWIFFSALGLLSLKFRKTKYFKLLLFFLAWILAFSFFVALAVPNDTNSLLAPYDWNTMRYRYFAFIGASIVTTILFANFYEGLKKLKTKKILIAIFTGTVAINLLLIWRIEANTYQIAFKPDKEFFVQFKKEFPSLPQNPIFYLYPLTSGLNDYMLELYYISDSDYPQLSKTPYKVESQIIAIIDKIKKGKINLSQVLFLDYNQSKGLLNKTRDVDKIIIDQKKYSVNLEKTKESIIESGPIQGPNTEFPYNLNFNLSSSLNNQFLGSQPDSPKFRALVDYNIEKKSYLDTVSLTTSYTASQRPGEPFFHTLPNHLIDGNIGPRSHWTADTFSPWVQVDLGKTEEVTAVAWGSLTGPRSPATYSIFASEDGKTWIKVKSVKNFDKTETIDVLGNPTRARYVKMEVYTTSGGDFLLLDEFEVLNLNESRIFSFYKDRDELFKDANSMFKYVSGQDDLNYLQNKGLNYYWGKLTWETDKTSSAVNHQETYFPYRIDLLNQNISVEIPEGEVFAGSGEFLKKHITSIQFDFGKLPFNISIDSAIFVPRYQL